MLTRYSREEIKEIWSLENKYKTWLKIELICTKAMQKQGLVPEENLQEILQKANFNAKEIEKIELETKHDFVAFLHNVKSYVGKSSDYIHKGLTSSDVIDTAFSCLLSQSCELILQSLDKVLQSFKDKAIKYKYLSTVGRSHGVHAELTTFGLKMARFYAEFKRQKTRLLRAKEEIEVCAISGPVGTFSSISPDIQDFLAKELGFKSEDISTQIIPRDRYANLFATLALIASSIENVAVELRHLGRTEVLEVQEYFSKNQTGSSAMPHKKNPVLSENLTGIARVIRSTALPALENVALWHERDISHSSAERIIAPQATILTDFALQRLANIIENMFVFEENIEANINKLKGLIFSQNIMINLLDKDLDKNIVYKSLQECSFRVWNKETDFKTALLEHDFIGKNITENEIDEIFTSKSHLKHIDYIYNKVFN